MARKSISDFIPDDLDGQGVEIPHHFRKEADPAPATEPPRVPDPREPLSDGEDLLPQEQADLAACEVAIDTLRLAFWAAGKALQVIRDARLYRSTHPTFEAYCEDRWQMQRAHANRLIRAWPLAEALAPIGAKALNEGQIRELLPLVTEHGEEAAATVYRTIAETDGVRVTAAVLRGVVGVLPSDHFDQAEAIRQIHAYLAGELKPTEEPTDPAGVWRAEADRLRATVRRVVTRPAWRTAAREHPEQARAVIAELRELLDEAEREAGDA
jgi:hypothetical protein